MTRHDEIVADLERQWRALAQIRAAEELWALLSKAGLLPDFKDEFQPALARTHPGGADRVH